MTDNKEFDNLRTLHAATTPGEWKAVEPGPRPTITAPTGIALATVYQWHGRDDAAFIVAAHNELPSLLARLDEVTAERDALATVVEKAMRIAARDNDVVLYRILSAAPPSVLAAHDAKVRAEALREAADADDLPYLTIHPSGSPILALPYAARGESVELSDWLRARADKEENR